LWIFYGVANVLWLGDGKWVMITDGHIDDITRFVDEERWLLYLKKIKGDENYKH